MGKKLAIKGHPTRGKEVIKLLEMMGGKDSNDFKCSNSNRFYHILNEHVCWGYIEFEEIDKYEIFTLEEFLEKYPFKVGDKVVVRNGEMLTIKSMEWSEDCETMVYDFKDSVIVLAAEDLLKYNAVETKSLTVSLKDDKAIGNSIDSVQIMQSGKIVAVRFNTQNYDNEVELQLDDYEIEIRDGKTYAVRKKHVYPKLTNLTECKEILGERNMYQSVSGYKGEILTNFQLLFIFRDVYWKIAGEEMGLDKPWEPDNNDVVYSIVRTKNTLCLSDALWGGNCNILEFPTEEMRDAFFKNFKKEIEQCKELL